MTDSEPQAAPSADPAAFARAVGAFRPDAPALVLSHDDADGLSAGALLVRALERAGRPVRIRLVGRGESPWSDALAAELRTLDLGGLVVADLGVRPEPLAPGVPTILIDHHVPRGLPADAVTISGYGLEPTPSSSCLAFRCAGGLAEVDDLAWLAALGAIGDYGEKAPLPEIARARESHTAKSLREATSLINAPRRSASGNARPALDLLLRARGPEEIASGRHPETALLREAVAEVKRALDEARRVPPKFAGRVAMLRLHSPCQIHPLVAQSWTGRLRGQIVMAMNTGFREGYVHFAARSATGENLVAFLREHAPPGSGDDEAYGNGHERATGGALKHESWNRFAAGLGFGAEMQV
jgi:single-stranded-DNA-specific exonuclease